MKILVIAPSWIGDMVMSQSLYRTLKVKYPSSKIDVIAPSWSYPVLSRMPEVNEALLIPLRHGVLALGERYRIGEILRQRNYQHAYVLPNSFKSALVPFFAGIKQRTGWRGEMRYGLINDIRVLNKLSFPLMIERYIALAYEKTIVHSAHDLPQPLLWPHLQVKDQEKIDTAIQFKLIDNRPLVGFCHGAEFGPAKRWPHYHYAVLAQHLIAMGYQVILISSVKEQSIGEQIRQTLRETERCYCRNLAGKTSLEQAMILLAHCDAVVTNDSGLMHIAAALYRPLIVLYGPSSPDFTPPLSQNARIIRLITGYHKIRKSNADFGYHQSLIDIKPMRVMEEFNVIMNCNKEGHV